MYPSSTGRCMHRAAWSPPDEAHPARKIECSGRAVRVQRTSTVLRLHLFTSGLW